MTRFGRVESLQIPDNVRLREGVQWSRERRGRSSCCGRQESDLFEQAIFLLREEALEQHGVTEQALLGGGTPPCRRTAVRHARTAGIPAFLYAAMGAASVGLAWLSCVLIF